MTPDEHVDHSDAGSDDFEQLGTSIASVLRAAHESAVTITEDADAAARMIREHAQRDADGLRAEAASMLAQANREAEQTRLEAEANLADARAEAERVLRTASERARQLDIETDARIQSKLDELARREATLRESLQRASEDLQLALLALDDDATQAATTADAPTASSNGHAPAWS